MEKTYLNYQDGLFRKYARIVTWLANTQLGRDYLKHNNLSIPDGEISLLLPNGYIAPVNKAKNKYKLTVTTRPCYATRIYPALQALDLVSGWLNNFEEAQRVILGHLDLISYGRIPQVARSLNFSTLTAYPDANPETTTFDGYAARSGVDESFASNIGGNGNNTGDTAAQYSAPYIASSGTSNQFGNVVRALYLFDTSSLTSGAVVSAATLSFYGTGKSNQFGGTDPDFYVLEAITASNTGATASDFENMLTTSLGTKTYAAWDGAGWNDITLNASGISSIKTTSITKFGGKLGWDHLGSFGGVWNGGYAARFDNYHADNGSNKPKLEITYQIFGGGILLFM